MRKYIDLKLEDTLLVFKGFKEACNNLKIESILKNPLDYFYNNSTKEYFSYEEFLLCQDFIKYKFKKVLIIEKNIYDKYFPLYLNIENNIIEELLRNKDNEEVESEDSDIDIKKYLECFSFVENIGGQNYVIYNDYANFLDEDIEVEYISYYLNENIVEKKENVQNKEVIVDEIGYLNSLEINGDFFISEDIPKNLFAKIQIYNSNIDKKFFLKNVVENREIKKFRTDEILKKYWGHNQFRSLKIYNREKLDEKEKEVIEIYQDNIINRIIDESEEAYKGYGKDIFVTAPTGAGKSIIFQIPAIYLEEKYDKLTLIISPLIGLMKDQVITLEDKGYKKARTLNSEITLSEKEEIMEEIRNGQCKLLYLSPETLINNSLLGEIIKTEQKIGLIVIDEAHIVTTWGKQFRADYWYLGDHIQKIRKFYQKSERTSFIIAAFTATAIYGGVENMYEEIKTSLYMNNPHTYLGYVKRENIEFKIKEVPKKNSRSEYQLVKYDSLIEKIKQNLIFNKKILIYFPTISLIDDFNQYLRSTSLKNQVIKYYGSLEKTDKDDSLEQFKNGNKKVMLATKAFGMGIDIDDISIVMHFAPTGNLCDYLQEIGRAARKKDIKGEAIYEHMSNDFKYINRFHGLSSIKIYQLVEVVKKIYELHLYSWKKKENKKRNEMLVDTSAFSYIFDTNDFIEDDAILNKVKTALLLIQKDFENLKGWSPFTMRPLPLFAFGYFKMDYASFDSLKGRYGNVLENIKNDIYKVNLKKIWEKSYTKEMSYPKFKFHLYTQKELHNEQLSSLLPYLKIDISKSKKIKSNLQEAIIEILDKIEKALGPYILQSNYISREELNLVFEKSFNKSSYKSKVLVDVFLSTVDYYKTEINKALNKKIYQDKLLKESIKEYRFLPGIENYYKWIKRQIKYIDNQIEEETDLYIEMYKSEEILKILGFCESFSLLTFKSLGGEGGQLYIYVNETKSLLKIKDNPNFYKNKLLENIEERHKLNVNLLSHIYTSNYTSKEIWDIIEDYFIGKEPETLKK